MRLLNQNNYVDGNSNDEFIRRHSSTRRHNSSETSNGLFSVKPSELFGSLKKSVKSSLRESTPRDVKCECKQHQQKYLEKQEEQRKRLKLQLLQRGDWRKASALTRSYLTKGYN